MRGGWRVRDREGQRDKVPKPSRDHKEADIRSSNISMIRTAIVL
jgi:hypothetical protein